GRPEEKADFAEKLDEMADMYKNLLQEAAQSNPNILQDPKTQEANNAVDSMLHAVKLMAAKEIPTSLSATQQISAEVTQSPEEWKNLKGHTVDRLLQSMEGGLEKAVQDIQADQERQQDQEMAQEMAESSALQGNMQRKKRRRRGQRSGVGGRKQQK